VKADDIEVCQTLAEEFIATQGGGRIVTTLGDGGSAVVFKWEQQGVLRALKVYDPKFLASDAAPAERNRLDLQRRLVNHHCPSMVDTLAVDEHLGTCFVTMEFFDGVELKKVIGQVPDDAVEALITQLVAAVQFLENFGLVHRDIKPENILVSADFTQLRLLDLGVVREISGDEDRIDGTDHGDRRPFIATAQYSSPEYLFRLEAPSPALWKALTIYQVGGVLHDLVCKRPLFDKAVAADNKYALAMSVMRERPDFLGASAKLSNWAALSARCLAKDSDLRLRTVDWPDFVARAQSPMEKLKRALAARAASAARAELNETQAEVLHQARERRLVNVVDELCNQLINDFSPHLRVSYLCSDASRLCRLLRLTDVRLPVHLEIECSWESGLREKFGAVRLAARAAQEEESNRNEGAWRPIGEVHVDGTGQDQLFHMLVETVSDLLVKYVDLMETGGVADGADLVTLTWPT